MNHPTTHLPHPNSVQQQLKHSTHGSNRHLSGQYLYLRMCLSCLPLGLLKTEVWSIFQTFRLWKNHCKGFGVAERTPSTASKRLTFQRTSGRHQGSLAFTISQSLFKLMFFESVMPSNHLILCHPLQSFPASGSFLMSQLFTSGGQRRMLSFPLFPLRLTCWKVTILL